MGVPVVGTMMRKVFGTRNERMVKRYLRVVDQVSAYEDQIRPLTDKQIRNKKDEFRKRIADGEKASTLMHEVFAIAREAMDRNVGLRNMFNPKHNFDPTQLPDAARKLYDETKAIIDKTDAAEPVG